MTRPDGIHGPTRARYSDAIIARIGDQVIGHGTTHERVIVERIRHNAGAVWLFADDPDSIVRVPLGWFWADSLNRVPSPADAAAAAREAAA